jgi:YjbE family integral membrane protein
MRIFIPGGMIVENLSVFLAVPVWLCQTLAAILSITLIDLVLSGDNAAVIGLAIRNLPRPMQKKAAIFGAAGAVILRVIFTIFAVYLLTVKYLSAIGGIILIFITYKLLNTKNEAEVNVRAANKFWSAVGTIIVADISMAFDNVMGVAGAAHGEAWLVVFGLLLSIPILVWGSTWLATMMGRYPLIIYIGATVLAHTAISMIFSDPALQLTRWTGEFFGKIIPWALALPILIYGFVTANMRRCRL